MTVAGFDRERLETALVTVNAARSLDPGSSRRVEGLLRGLEDILAAERGSADRDRDGARALAELDRLLAGVGSESDAVQVREFLEPIVDRLIDALLGRPDQRLASYGSLRPGEVNHHQVGAIVGTWSPATVRGVFHASGGDPTRGFPGVEWRPEGAELPLQIFESLALPAHWDRLDAFEGPGYRRVLVTLDTDTEPKVANMYEILRPPIAGAQETST
ncbi:MAG: gamma-glutamylcyclotransferase [Gemmatimonadota bacterium]|nr:gamma-glutamylcyclotransferase [Gemmatimonadota bacterium]